MRETFPALGLLLVALGAASACEETRCRGDLSAYRVDETRYCLQTSMSIPELQACGPYPPTRGVRIVCLVDTLGQLYIGTAGDSERLSGSGWRYSDGTGQRALWAADTQRCSAAVESIGYPDSAKLCSQ